MPSPKELAKALAYQGEIRNTSRNRLLGGVADALSPVSEFADQYKISDRIPFLGGMSAADLTGLKGAQSLVNDMSYGKSPISGASLQTTKVDPRVIDLAGVSGAMMPVGKAALREVAKQVQNKTGIIGRNVIDPRMSVVPDDQAMSVSNRLLDTTGLENRGRDLIQGKAEELAQRMREAGVTVDLQHSGSVAGPSSYIKVVGMPDIRISGHSKGVFNSGGVLNVASPEEFDNVLAMAIKNQQQYNSQQAVMKNMYEDAAIPIRLKSADKKIAKGLKLTNSEQAAVNVRAAPKPIDVGGAMMQRPKTEFEILHDTAQKNAALPVKQGGLGLPANNTYIDRANAPGMWPDDGYHGSMSNIKKFKESKASTESHAGRGTYITDSPEDASLNYANIYGPDVKQKVELSMEQLADDRNSIDRIARRFRDENLTPGQQEVLLANTTEADNLGVVYPLRYRSDMPVHLDKPQAKETSVGPFEKYDEEYDDYTATPAAGDLAHALREYENAGGDSSHIHDVISNVAGESVPAQDIYRAAMKGANYMTDEDTGNIISGGVAASDFLKHFGVDQIAHTPQFRNQHLNIGTQHTVVMKPENIRSRFAAFDPMRRHEADILAGVGVGGMLDPQAIAEALRQQDRK